MDLILEPLTPYESNVVCNANDVLHALARAPSPRLFSMVDICAPYVQAEPAANGKLFEQLGDKLRHLHIVDSDGASDNRLHSRRRQNAAAGADARYYRPGL